jgi:hypothetical protein
MDSEKELDSDYEIQSDPQDQEMNQYGEKFTEMPIKGKICYQDIASENVELWLLKVPVHFDVSMLSGKKLKLSKVPKANGEVGRIKVPLSSPQRDNSTNKNHDAHNSQIVQSSGGNKSEEQQVQRFLLLEGLPCEFQDLVNVFPGVQDGKKRLMLGKPFSRLLNFVEIFNFPKKRNDGGPIVQPKRPPPLPELTVHYIPPGAQLPQKISSLSSQRGGKQNDTNRMGSDEVRETLSHRHKEETVTNISASSKTSERKSKKRKIDHINISVNDGKLPDERVNGTTDHQHTTNVTDKKQKKENI